MHWQAQCEEFRDLILQSGKELRQIHSDAVFDLALVADIALDPCFTLEVARAFWPLMLEIEAKWVTGTAPVSHIIAALASLVKLIPATVELVEVCLEQHPDFLDDEPSEELLKAVFRLLYAERTRFLPYIAADKLYNAALSQDASKRALALAGLALLAEAAPGLQNHWAEQLGIHVPNTLHLEEARRIAESKAYLEPGIARARDTEVMTDSNFVVSIGGLLIPKSPSAAKSTDPGLRVVETATTRANLRRIAAGLLTGKPLLLQGASGAGKTHLVEWIHSLVSPQGQELVRIHLGDQTDAKGLIGTYTTGEYAGTFEWKPGMLTEAVRRGQWVLVEDLDRAPTEILSVLLPLLEHRRLIIASRNHEEIAHAGFRLLATTTQTQFEGIGSRAWLSLPIESPTSSDLQEIISLAFPNSSKYASTFVAAFEDVRTLGLGKNSARVLTTRDLFKLAARTNKQTADEVFLEAVTCFSGWVPDEMRVLEIAAAIGEHLGVGPARARVLLTRHQPQLNVEPNLIQVGRATLAVKSGGTTSPITAKFALTTHVLRLLEQVAAATQAREALLLVGETGTGKTTLIQHLAKLCRRRLVVVNVSQQIESGDLLGGFRPIDARQAAAPVLDEFWDLFDSSFTRSKNAQFCDAIEKSSRLGRWMNVIKLWKEAARMARAYVNSSPANTFESAQAAKRRRVAASLPEWDAFMARVDGFEARILEIQKSVVFQFVEGLVVRAVRQGWWLLLDEVNLAPADTLEGISDLLAPSPSVTIVETGEVVHAHPDFRLFACMNPATDVGKRDLPPGVRSRFTELWVPSPDRHMEDLQAIVTSYVSETAASDIHVVNDVSQLFVDARSLASTHKIVDGTNQRPHFNIRTLSRTLTYAAHLAPLYGLRRALYEGFCMSFLTQLDNPSAEMLHEYIVRHLLARLGNPQSVLAQMPSRPNGDYAKFGHYWLRRGPLESVEDGEYILTPSIERNLLNLVRACAAKQQFPVLIQGPTSSGKTSMIRHLALRTGHKFVRINNHEHTDLQEYLGTYIADSNGSLIFQEGVLVDAVRNGHWIVLDELNLAPTDVLEALNRLLDDNRELLIPETQEVVRPHPDFMLFATQNPPGLYAGRKQLSRAFRSRFLELHFGDIPPIELESILRDRAKIPPSYARKIVDVWRELGERRAANRIFERGQSFATLRDLFRWAGRPAVGYEDLARNGFLLLGERTRTLGERSIVRDVIERVMRVSLIDVDNYSVSQDVIDACPDVVWTRAMQRLVVLVLAALNQNEPVLLVGETGTGKTTVFQVLSRLWHCRLRIVNAHQNTETGDIVGAQRPVRRNPHRLAEILRSRFGDGDIKDLMQKWRDQVGSEKNFSVEDQEIEELSSNKLFTWEDGALVQSMREGSLFLLDEISLADDSVLERLNSVLEPERTLLLPEKGGVDISVSAQQGFQFFATMNPGGDYGKKELSPALRNRFTEIWVPSLDRKADVELVVRSRLEAPLVKFSAPITELSEWFSAELNPNADGAVVSLRDILAWVDFANATHRRFGPAIAVAQGAAMVFIDAIGAENRGGQKESEERRVAARSHVASVLGAEIVESTVIKGDEQEISIGLFSLTRGPKSVPTSFSLSAPTSALNAMRVMRALQVAKPILLEGSPGVGKTSLVSALAALAGRPLTRLNLSEQTDISDLFGSDVPAEGGGPGEFVWRDAPFLRAMRRGEWVLLDEMNLAPQPVLEGLNACLDHRGEAYIPELGMSFQKAPGFTVFAAQNPQHQGGGRKGLPKSFVNRFSVVWVDALGLQDLDVISGHLFSNVPSETRHSVVRYISLLEQRLYSAFGGPFEFNLRDTLRWFELLTEYPNSAPAEFWGAIVGQRLRTARDRDVAWQLFIDTFRSTYSPPFPRIAVNAENITAGIMTIRRGERYMPWFENVRSLHCNAAFIQTSLMCIRQGWPLLLVGPSGSGKTALVRQLASMAGARLREFAMSADIDASDLLGEFDQVERSQQLSRTWALIDEYASTLPGDLAQSVQLLAAVKARNLDLVSLLVSELPGGKSVSVAIEQFRATDFSKPMFKWFDGMLVEAVAHGHWLVLDNANLCSASVLDRLNSLLEPGGNLFVNEDAQADGEPRRVVPHPDFRLFLIADPRFGELSRAMRNRSVEVWIPSLDMRLESEDRKVIHQSNHRVTGALSPSASLSLSAARLADLLSDTKRAHWLVPRLPVDAKTLSASGTSSPALCDIVAFAEITTSRCLDKGLERLEAMWTAWQLEAQVTEIERMPLPVRPQSLLELSILSRTKPSVRCADAVGFIHAILPIVPVNPSLAAVIKDFFRFATVKEFDPSKVAIFRELIQAAAQSDEVAIVDRALPLLGSGYDFARGGAGMDRLWQAFGAPLAFGSLDSARFTELVTEIAEKFDRSSKFAGSALLSEVHTIRRGLVAALVLRTPVEDIDSVTEDLNIAVERVAEAAGSIDIKDRGVFPHVFKSIASLLGLHNLLNRSLTSDSYVLDDDLLSAAHFGGISTAELAQLASASSLSLPWAIHSAENASDAALGAISSIAEIPAGRLEAAMSEMDAICSLLERAAPRLAEPSDKSMSLLLPHFASELISVVPESSAPQSWRELGYSLLWWYLVPEVYDPAIRQHVHYECWQRRKADYDADDNWWTTARTVVLGDRTTEEDTWLAERVSALVVQPPPQVWRPSKPRIGELYADLSRWRSTLVRDHADAVRPGEPRSLWMRSVEALVNKLKGYSDYRDIVNVMITACHALMFDLDNAVSRGTLGWLLDVGVIASETNCRTHIVQTDERDLLHMNRSLILQVLRTGAIHGKTLIATVRPLLSRLYTDWRSGEVLRAEKSHREQATFRMAGEEAEAAEFTALFGYDPSSSDDHYDVPKCDLERLKTAAESEAALESFSDSECYCLAEAFLTLNNIGSHIQLSDVIRENADVLSKHPIFAGGVIPGRQLPAVWAALNAKKTPVYSNEFDFYRETHISETSKAVKLALRVQTRVIGFLARWPEHETLHRMRVLSNELLDAPASSPLASLLVRIERLHSSLDEWNRYSDYDATVADLLESTTQLIVQWRRLELSTWPRIFAFERRSAERAASQFWFYLWETLVVAPGEGVEIAHLLVLFISESSFGEFSMRMHLLESFGEFTGLTVVKNIVAYFEQYTPQIIESAERMEKTLRKEAQELVLLASWRDVNIHALRQSARRSHSTLYKLIRRYRDFLGSKITPIVQAAPTSQLPTITRVSFSDFSVGLSKFNNAAIHEDLPPYLQNVERTTEKMSATFSNVVIGVDAKLSELSANTMERARELRRETPREIDESDEKSASAIRKIVGSLRTEKAALLTATLRELREAGLRTSVRKDTVESQALISRIIATISSVQGPWAQVNSALWRFVEFLPRLRAAVAESQSDAPAAELQRAMAQAENTMSIILGSIRAASDVDIHLSRLEDSVNSINFIANRENHILHRDEDLSICGPDWVIWAKNLSEFASSLSLKGGKFSCPVPTAPQHGPWWRSKAAFEWLKSSQISWKESITLAPPLLSSILTPEQNLFSPLRDKAGDISGINNNTRVRETVIATANAILIRFQNVLKISVEKVDGWLSGAHRRADKMVRALRVAETTELLSEAVESLKDLSAENAELGYVWSTTLQPIALGYFCLCLRVSEEHASLLADTCRGATELALLLHSLATDGFCSPVDAGANAEDLGSKESGTGLGDGEGGKSSGQDLNEEDDDVAEAAQTENPDQKDREEEDGAEEDNATEIEGDMAGIVEDIPPPPSDEESDDNGTDEADAEDQVGDADGEDAVDEKMWNDESKEQSETDKRTEEGVDGDSKEAPEAAPESENNQRGGNDSDHDDMDADEGDPNQSDGEMGSDQVSEGESEASDIEEDQVRDGDHDMDAGVDQREALSLPEDLEELNLSNSEKNGGESEDESDIMSDGEEEQLDPLDKPVEQDAADDKHSDQEEIDSNSESADENKEAPLEKGSDVDGTAEDAHPVSESEQEDDARSDEEEAPAEEADNGQDGDGQVANTSAAALDAPPDDGDAEKELDIEQATAAVGPSSASVEGASHNTTVAEDVGDGGGDDNATTSYDNASISSEDQSEERKEQQKRMQDSLQELGDAMKRFHRREVQQRPQNNTENEAGQENELEHENSNDETADTGLMGADDQWDTQALGASTEHQDIDEKMAVEEPEEADAGADQDTLPTRDLQGGNEEGGLGEDNGNLQEDVESTDSECKEEGVPAEKMDWDSDGPTTDDDEDQAVTTEPQKITEFDAESAGDALWRDTESASRESALILSEQLRLILEPTLATKLRGDYKTGKRLNMKRIIPYIASDYRKDRIWLRRTKPAKRQYQVVLAVDDSRSMGEPHVAQLARQSVAVVAQALNSIEAGELAVISFGEDTRIVHDFSTPWTATAGQITLQQLNFDQNRTDVVRLLKSSLRLFDQAAANASNANSEQWRLEIVVSDGILDDQETIRQLVRKAHEEHVMLVFVVLDVLNRDASVLDMNEVRYVTGDSGAPQLEVQRYMDRFPFEYYVILNDIADLPNVLASVLRQYFQAVDSS